MNNTAYHIPALLPEAIEALNINPDGIYVDVTFGGGGHSREILKHLSDKGRLFGFDRDRDAFQNAPDDPRFTFVHSDFRYISNFLRYHGVDRVDGILADLGVSFHHFDQADRGFSFRADAPLDMRMNRNAPLTAADVVADYSPDRLGEVFRQYTDLKQARAVAAAIVKARQEAPVDTTFRLAEAVAKALPPQRQKQDLAQVFQALRIEVNDEMGALRALLSQSVDVLAPGGRCAVITYHSIEDRLVKNFFRAGNFSGEVEKDFYGKSLSPWKVITKSPVTPDQEEIERNPRSRSAKLRVAELLPSQSEE